MVLESEFPLFRRDGSGGGEGARGFCDARTEAREEATIASVKEGRGSVVVLVVAEAVGLTLFVPGVLGREGELDGAARCTAVDRLVGGKSGGEERIGEDGCRGERRVGDWVDEAEENVSSDELEAGRPGPEDGAEVATFE